MLLVTLAWLVWSLNYFSVSVISPIFQIKLWPMVAFRAAVDKEMAGSRYDSDFLFLSASWGHPSYLYHKGVCHPRHTDDSGMAQSHKPIFLPSRFLSSLMPHTLSLFICLHHHANTHRKSERKKREKRYMHVRSGICRESAAPAETRWQAGWRQRGGHPTPHSGV